jgi:aminomethyltransferase
LPNGKGGVVDDMLVYRFNNEKYLLVPNAANIDKDFAWISKYAEELGVQVGKDFVNASADYAQLAVQGPLALKAMQKLTDTPVEDMKYYTFKVIDFAGIKNVIFSTTGYTGAGGCEIYVKNEDAQTLWNAVYAAGAGYGIEPAGLGARDTLRLEMGFCLYGHEIDDTISPIEAGLGWITKFVDNKPFIDREKMLALKQNGVERKIVGFEMLENGIPRQGYQITNENDEIIGEVRSGTQSPSLNKGIGTALIKAEYAKIGTQLKIKIRDKSIKIQVVKMPFLQ